MRLLPVLFFSMITAIPAWAGQQNITLYLDGAIVEQQVTARKGLVEIRLPSDMQKGSLRIRPLDRSRIERVDVLPASRETLRERELARLTERQGELSDRLKALETREEIFRAAAKSQSGKAPRKTKANPQPLATLRQGTEFAIAQLEEVYRLRRKAEKDLKQIELKLAALRKESGSGDSVARIRLAGSAAKVAVSYIRSGLNWTPRYDFRLSGAETAEVTLHAVLPQLPKEAAVAVVPAGLADGVAAKTLPVHDVNKGAAAVASIRLPAASVQYASGPRSTLSFAVTNTGTYRLPAGEVSCYWKGEYIGSIPFSGCGNAEKFNLSAGK